MPHKYWSVVHNVLMTGPPGAGKTLMARAMPSILPSMTVEEALEVRGRVKEIIGCKVLLAATLSAEGELCARGEVAAVQTPEHMTPGKAVT
jgi:predicted ATPase with chaperone activity